MTLVGDACQAVSLLAGQGASMAVGGAYLLTHELRANMPVEKCLAKYEARLKPIIEYKQAAIGLPHAYRPTGPTRPVGGCHGGRGPVRNQVLNAE